MAKAGGVCACSAGMRSSPWCKSGFADLEAEIGRDEAEHFLRRFLDQIWISSFAGEDELMGHVPSVGQTRVAAPK